MKRLSIFILSMLLFLSAYSQKIKESEVPAGVMKSYRMKIVDTVPTTWTKADTYYTAHFVKSNLKANMVFSENSDWIWTRWNIPRQYLPKKVQEYLTANYPKYKIKSTVIEYKPGGEYYLVGLKLKKNNPKLRFSIKSEFIGIEPESTPR